MLLVTEYWLTES